MRTTKPSNEQPKKTLAIRATTIRSFGVASGVRTGCDGKSWHFTSVPPTGCKLSNCRTSM